ncbi:MAG: VIT1/CCC1 transporter family protein [Candidatus Vogelbacteria bacterium]|nr:VIT1/CCC1 transporter family protein [Candidatus Vogelbacteria bacterium]
MLSTESRESRGCCIAEVRKEPGLTSALDGITSDRKTWTNFMMREELGIVEDSISAPWLHGLVTMVAFVVVGFLPLTPYMFGVAVESQFAVSVIATAVSLFVIGSLSALVTGANWFKSGVQMLIVGSLAALSAYLVGGIVKDLLGISI